MFNLMITNTNTKSSFSENILLANECFLDIEHTTEGYNFERESNLFHFFTLIFELLFKLIPIHDKYTHLSVFLKIELYL